MTVSEGTRERHETGAKTAANFASIKCRLSCARSSVNPRSYTGKKHVRGVSVYVGSLSLTFAHRLAPDFTVKLSGGMTYASVNDHVEPRHERGNVPCRMGSKFE